MAAATAAAQYYQSEKARGATKDRLKELEKDFNKLVPPGYDVKVSDPPAYIRQSVGEPTMDMSSITPEQYKQVEKYKPDVAPYILEQNPELVKESATAKEGQQARIDAMRRLKQVASEGGDPEFAQAMRKAAQNAQVEAQSRNQSVLQGMARRGQLNTGMQLAAQLQGNSDAMSRNAQMSGDAAVQSYRNKLQSLKDSAALGGQIRDDEMSLAGKNTDIINSFNERTSRNRQNWENQRVGTLNDAQARNIAQAQELANMNTGDRNKAAFADRDRRDQLQKYLYGIRNDERNYQNQLTDKEANWREEQRKYGNQMKSQDFDNQHRLTMGRQGIGVQGINYMREDTRDKNQAIQGLGNAAASSYMYSQGSTPAKANTVGGVSSNSGSYQSNPYNYDDEERRRRMDA
jgi:hypothetical protein